MKFVERFVPLGFRSNPGAPPRFSLEGLKLFSGHVIAGYAIVPCAGTNVTAFDENCSWTKNMGVA